ncbi:hypothetical protein K5X82_08900 [Halosquirtibacter xylanolyticus]|uniref:hypothetical protein n=1 Tax=Halosquirtibacter xylanolyticus TaxID=3374599 RepID=UPI00374A5D41|nr:hypothetical protein K5X82_08900 [Prolixibacteraceae bacterium]
MTDPKIISDVDMNRVMLAKNQMKDPTLMLVLQFFLGWSYGSLDKIGTQILFYITFAGFGIWGLIRLFTVMSATREYNRTKCARLGFSNAEIAATGWS